MARIVNVQIQKIVSLDTCGSMTVESVGRGSYFVATVTSHHCDARTETLFRRINTMEMRYISSNRCIGTQISE